MSLFNLIKPVSLKLRKFCILIESIIIWVLHQSIQTSRQGVSVTLSDRRQDAYKHNPHHLETKNQNALNASFLLNKTSDYGSEGLKLSVLYYLPSIFNLLPQHGSENHLNVFKETVVAIVIAVHADLVRINNIIIIPNSYLLS